MANLASQKADDALTIRKNRHGKFLVDVQIEMPDGTISRIRKVSPVQTKRGAEQYERELRQAVLDGSRVRKEDRREAAPTLAAFEDEFLKASVGRGNKPRYLDSQRQILRDHLLPRFGRVRLDEITEAEIDRFRDDQIAKGLSRKTVRNHLEILRRVLKVAHRRKLIAGVPVVELPKKSAKKINFLSFTETEAFLAAAPDKWRPIFFFTIRTGLRLGEVRGLKWSHLNLDEASVYVQEQQDDAGVVSTLKSDACRTVNLAWDVVEMLRKHPRHGSLVFPGVTDRSAWWFTTSTAKRSGLGRHLTFHDLRHTFASHCAMKGVDVETLRQWLGHASIATTQIYLHVCGTHRRMAADLLAPPRLRVVDAEPRHPDGTPQEEKSKTAS